MDIKATQYTREDGICMLQIPNGNWVIRRVGPGPSWFYEIGGGWHISSVPGFRTELYSYDFDTAMDVLKNGLKYGVK